MVAYVLRPFRRLLQALLASDSPRQLAAGFALGMVLGLVPKGNLIAVSLFVLLFSLRVNTGLALVATLLFSWTSVFLDPFANKLGLEVLSAKSMQAAYASVFNLPLGPWLGFDNTVVTGSLLIGIYFLYPVYWLTYLVCRRFQPLAVSSTDNLSHNRPPTGTDNSIERRAA